MDQFQINEQQLLKNFLSNFYFKYKKFNNWTCGDSIKLIYKSNNYTNCSYCDCAIIEEEIDNNIICNNLSILLKELIKNKIYIPIYSIYCNNYYFNILDIFIDKLSNIPEDIKFKFDSTTIIFNTNKINLDILSQIEKYNEILKQNKITLKFIFTIENPKQIINTKYLVFLEQKQYQLQPIINTNNIININDIIDEYFYIIEHYPDIKILPFKLIKDNSWTQQQIEKYQKFIRYIWSKFSQINQNQLYDVFNLDNNLFDICKLNWDQNQIRCDLNNLFINLYNLSLPICPLLNKPQFIGGYYNIQQDEPINLMPQNVSGYIQIKSLSPNFYPKCIKCIYKHICNRGCLGQQFEVSSEVLVPIQNICQLEQIRINTLIDLYIDSGLLQYLFDNNLIENKFLQEWLMLIKQKKDLNN